MNTVRNFTIPDKLITTFDVSPDGKILVVGQRESGKSEISLALWSIDDCTLIDEIYSDRTVPTIARFSPSGKLLAFTGGDQSLIIQDMRSGTTDRTVLSLPFIKWMSFAWNCDRLIVGGGARTHVWDGETNEIIWTLPNKLSYRKNNPVPAFCTISADGKLVAASGVESKQIVIYSVESGEIVGRIAETMNLALSMSFDNAGRFLAAIADSGGVGIWDLDSGQSILPKMLNMRTNYYHCVKFHPNSKHVGFGLWSGFVELIRLSDGKYLVNQNTPIHSGRVLDLVFTRDGKQMISGGDDRRILIWNIQNSL